MTVESEDHKTAEQVDPSSNIHLDDLLTPAEFGQWIGESESWVRRRLASLPGVIREGRKHIRIHPRTYLEKRLRFGLAAQSRSPS